MSIYLCNRCDVERNVLGYCSACGAGEFRIAEEAVDGQKEGSKEEGGQEDGQEEGCKEENGGGKTQEG